MYSKKEEQWQQQGLRSVLILQNNVGNMFSSTTTIVPITTKEYKGKNQPTYVRIKQLNKIRLIPLYY